MGLEFIHCLKKPGWNKIRFCWGFACDFFFLGQFFEKEDLPLCFITLLCHIRKQLWCKGDADTRIPKVLKFITLQWLIKFNRQRRLQQNYRTSSILSAIYYSNEYLLFLNIYIQLLSIIQYLSMFLQALLIKAL